MPALTAAVQWSRLQGDRRLAKAFPRAVFLKSPSAADALCHPPIPLSSTPKKLPLSPYIRTGLEKVLTDSSKPDECVIRLAPYLRGAANVLICGDFG